MNRHEQGDRRLHPERSKGEVNGRGTASTIGIVEWFRPGEYEQVERVLADMHVLGITNLRTGVSWADWLTEGGQEWYDWLIPRVSHKVEVLPCFLYTPPSLGVVPKTSSPPRDPKAYADFIDVMISRYGEHFEWVELWNEANNMREWDMTLDPEWVTFCTMLGGAAYWAKKRGKKTLLAGMSPVDPNWISLMFDRGVMQYIDAVGLHGFPDTYEYCWEGWEPNVCRIRDVLKQHDSGAELWITEVGFSTWQYDERRQLNEFVKAIEAPVDRVYWYEAYDLDPNLPTVDGFHLDERDYHFGLKRADGSGKLLYRLWMNGGLDAVLEASWLGEPPPSMGRDLKSRPIQSSVPNARRGQKVLITGGAGFIGTNLAHKLLDSGRSVLVYDNLSRPGVERNLQWLRETHGERVQVEVADVRDRFAVRRAVEGVDQVFHLAAQVAVTTSLTGPIHDFEVNVGGTLNLLEALRALEDPPSLVFTSTNKVYGNLQDAGFQRDGTRYEPTDEILRTTGISENCSLNFHSPYGCSKGAADQYVIDYAKVFGLPTVVFRMSCIYGPHQFGTEDQGWVAHFLIRAMEGLPITLYGDGMQVRDLLYVDDLVEAFLLAQANMDKTRGQAFNIGGGPANTMSLVELADYIAELQGRKAELRFDGWRPGDQRYFVSDTGKFEATTGWRQRVGVREGVKRLYDWLAEGREIVQNAK